MHKKDQEYENNFDKVCYAVARIAMNAGMIACGYGVYKLLGLLNAPEAIQVLSIIPVMAAVGYCFGRYETIVKRLGQLEN
jgi:hypothetical protein